jgi:indole-3-glycerol phosphate synthase
MSTILDGIVAHHRQLAANDARDLGALMEKAAALPPPRPFRNALAHQEGVSVVAEVKRRSPSKGPLAPELDPAQLAVAYQSGGAACLSVLTDEEFFGGTADDLFRARQACGLPVLRKDFTVSALDVCDARLMGADAALLIVAALEDQELGSFLQTARELAMAALVEVHDERELEAALGAGADLVGVNQRDLRTFEVEVGRAERLAERLPPGVVAVAESGIAAPEDVRVLGEAGYHAVLVGESLVTAEDPAGAVRRLREASRA